ncbi:MAG: hypothetical protein OEZ08_16075 [Betaproteobacteria bacterium]|nr:hypothetical protein [Betaproteobacteria bacterium]
MMITTDAFSSFGRRIAATKGFPHVVIAETPNPIRQLDEASMHKRAVAMIDTVVFGLTQPPAAIERAIRDRAREQIHPKGVVRAAKPV